MPVEGEPDPCWEVVLHRHPVARGSPQPRRSDNLFLAADPGGLRHRSTDRARLLATILFPSCASIVSWFSDCSFLRPG